MLALVGPLAPHVGAGVMNFNNSADNYAGSPVAVTGVGVAFYDGNGPTPTRHLSNYDAEITRLEFASYVIVPSVYVSVADNWSTGGNGTGWIYGYDGDTQVWSGSVSWIGGQPPIEDDWVKQILTQVTAGAGKPINNIRLYNSGGTPDQWLRVDDMTVNVGGNYWAPKPDAPFGGGTGTWASTSNVWATSAGTQGTLPQATTGALIFTDAAGVVTVNSTATVGAGMTFKANGYSLVAGTGTPNINLNGTTLAANTITVDPGVTATIALQLTGGDNGMTLAGAGTLELKNTGTGLSQTLAGPLALAGGDVTLKSNNAGTGTLSTTFGALTARVAGNTGNIVSTGGTNGTDNLINLTAGTAGFLDKGVFFNGADYAALHVAGPSYVRALNYATAGGDPNTVDVNTITASKHVKLTATPANQNSVSLLSLNLSGSGVNYTQNASQTLTVPGIIKSGGGSVSTISGGDAVTAGTGIELVIRTDTSSDLLTISTPITDTGALTKSGAGTLTLSAANSFTGSSYVNGGVLSVTDNNQLGVATSTPHLFGGTLQTTGNFSLNTGGTNRNIHLGPAGGTVEVTAGTLTIDGVVRKAPSALSPDGGLTKSGPGTLILSGVNTYTGNTTVSAGKLRLGEGTTKGSMGATAVSVTGTATYGTSYASSGTTIAGGSTLSLAGGTTLDLQDGYTNTMSFTSTGAFDGASLKFDLNTTAGDILALTSTASQSNTNTFYFNALGSLATGPAAYTLVTASGGLNLANFIPGTLPGYTLTLSGGGTAINLDVAAIPTHIAGDANEDGYVDAQDYIVVSGSYGKTPAVWTDGDVFVDNVVDAQDYVEISGHYGEGVPVPLGASSLGASSTVPEPSTLILLAIGGAVLAFSRRKQLLSLSVRNSTVRTILTKGACVMRNVVKKMAGPGAAILALVLTAGIARAEILPTVDLSMTVDQVAKTWKVYATITDPENRTSGL
ncbi:MAG: autotransporter-associated beta strand repeat-containing protein, partial [Planctomycetota bacterium]|nr:autotransporter-associated beta strand repeat-containing protein [Planctomycetota bacterium]